MKTFLVLLALVSSNLVLALDPPWDLFAERVKAALGADPCVTVGTLTDPTDPDAPSVIPVTVCDHDKAVALSEIVAGTTKIAGVPIVIQFSDSQGVITANDVSNSTAEEASEIVETALRGNRFFKRTVQASSSAMGNAVLWVEFRAQVLQYTADNIGNLYGQNNEVAQQTFSLFLSFQGFKAVRIQTTSAKRHH